MGSYAAVVLAGGAARRMGGVDKPALPVGGRSMRDRVLAAVADAAPRVLVGPAEAVPPGVRVTREDPPGGGPVAAMAAGLARLDPDTTLVAVLAADLPLLTRFAIGELLAQLTPTEHRAPADPRAAADQRAADPRAAADQPKADRAAADHREVGAAESSPGTGPAGRGRLLDGVCFVDADGRRQSLCGVWRVAALRAGLDRLAAGRGGDLAGAPVRALLGGLVVGEVPWGGDGGPPPWFDCDTDEDVRRAEEWVR
ncbi:NTP transferase domain-containing protein [Micromonospora sp. WMMD710]|uniref:molybdenum cofactor guanylyltransferase n=1 Tax=Micromonospora sp. WMMD710 TaxID=3016085 RepID=UPI002415AEF5|nr:NTP transferase domain-containing protein [Micromonospora sp. WMMD710]MDG4761229.1 NTP transferase domain-containing protein [Micromonospora sp. WMMD710]